MALGAPPPGLPPNPLLPGVMPGRPPAPGAQPPVAPPQAPSAVPAGALQPAPQAPPGLTGLGTPGNLEKALRAAGIDLPAKPAVKEPQVGRRSPRGAPDHVYEVVAHDLAEWLHKMPKVLAAALRGGPHRQGPFMHAATGQQKYEIFKAKLFNEDGSPNLQGRQQLLERLTPRQYAEVVHIVTRQMKRRGEAGEGMPDVER